MTKEHDGSEHFQVDYLQSDGYSLPYDYRISELPYPVQWKMMGQGEYVLGLEPCNVPGRNRKVLKDENNLSTLEPGEVSIKRIEIILNEIK
jgi:hypothetical protein